MAEKQKSKDRESNQHALSQTISITQRPHQKNKNRIRLTRERQNKGGKTDQLKIQQHPPRTKNETLKITASPQGTLHEQRRRRIAPTN
jgi:hypothetical protein